MLCEICKEREAVIHITQIAGAAMAKHDYCDECGRKFMPPGGINIPYLLDAAKEGARGFYDLLPKDTRFPVEAFEFVWQAVEMAFAEAGFKHVPAKVLVDTLRNLALVRFRGKARSKLAGWSIHRIEDFGEIVFAMINAGLLSKRPEDKIEDFANGYDFDEAFPED